MNIFIEWDLLKHVHLSSHVNISIARWQLENIYDIEEICLLSYTNSENTTSNTLQLER